MSFQFYLRRGALACARIQPLLTTTQILVRHLCAGLSSAAASSATKIVALLVALSFSCGLAHAELPKRPAKVWWRSNIANVGPGPLGSVSTPGGNCEYCLRNSGVRTSPAWTGVLTPVGSADFDSLKGCQFRRDDGGTQDNGCVVGRSFWCPDGYTQTGDSCIANGPDPDKNKGCPDSCPKGIPGPPVSEGNPINSVTGNKYQIETDFIGAGSFPLVWQRVYNSHGNLQGNAMLMSSSVAGNRGWSVFNPPANGVGPNGHEAFVVGEASNTLFGNSWRHSYDRVLRTATSAAMSVVSLIRENSVNDTFTKIDGVWVVDAGGVTTGLTEIRDGGGQLTGWLYTNQFEEVESYDAVGKLQSIRSRSGLSQTLSYNAQGQLVSISDPAGRSLTLAYNDKNQLVAVTDPAEAIYTYAYDAAGNLTHATYPGQLVRQYLYEDVRFPSALTGFIDENTIRYATWAYDAAGNAVLSQHANGVDKVTLAYTASQTAATDSSGATRTYAKTVRNGVVKAGSIAETCGPGCARSRTFTYDVNGNIDIGTDWNGSKTKYSYDLVRNLETQRIEAFGTPLARTITTIWEPGERLRRQVAEPLRMTRFTYFPNGKLQSKSEQASNDATGAAGMAATGVGIARIWQYTYNAVGQLLTVTGPRTDVIDKTTYVYDAKGDLASVTNAALQTTLLSNYDASGRVGRITDPNGLTTDYTYTPRGWLATRITSKGGLSEQTTYEYDGVGQTKKVILPDLSIISYTYDDAHRLTAITDSAGNSIVYTLDDSGNRLREQVKDLSGVLARQTSRIFDALNRVKQVTGAAQ